MKATKGRYVGGGGSIYIHIHIHMHACILVCIGFRYEANKTTRYKRLSDAFNGFNAFEDLVPCLGACVAGDTQFGKSGNASSCCK